MQLKRGLVALVCLAALIGWFGVQAVQAQDHGSMMMDSGFKQWNVDTDKEKAFFENHPAGNLVTYKKANNVVHVYKDPQTGVIYVGNGDALQAYVKQAKAQNITPVSRQDAAQQDDPDFWLNWEDEYGP